MRKKLVGAAASFAVAAVTLTGPGLMPAQAAPGKPAAAPPVVWTGCTDPFLKSQGAQCSKVTVPLDWAKPGGTKIKIAISRIKHTVPASQYQGVMLVNPGGPGGSGLQLSYLGQLIPKVNGKVVGGAYDWIGFDPRGVGDSEPQVSCDPDYAGYNRPKYDPDTTFPYTTYDKTDPWPARTNAYTDACKANNDYKVLGHLTTKDVARDMDLIRQKLGQTRINYYGFSYGTYLGQVFSSMFPTRVRRMVFDGTVDPRGVWYKANLDQDVAFDRNINLWFRWLASHDDAYHLGNTTLKVRAKFYETRDALYADPVTGDGGKLGGSEWTDAFLYAGYYVSTWTDLAETFAGYVNDNDVAAFEASYLDASGFGDDNGYAVYLGVQCTDTKWPLDWATWKKDNDAVNAVAPFETWSNAWYNEPCRHWPSIQRTPQTISGKNVPNLLLVNETLDAATPYAGSLEVRKRYPHSSLVATPSGTTHSNSLNGNACVDNTIARFLYDGTRPKRVSGNQADKYCTKLPLPEPSDSAKSQKRSAVPEFSRLDVQKMAVRP